MERVLREVKTLSYVVSSLLSPLSSLLSSSLLSSPLLSSPLLSYPLLSLALSLTPSGASTTNTWYATTSPG
jgi:hypothetical protein